LILRVIRGRIAAGRLDDVVATYRRAYAPVADRAAGLERYAIGVSSRADGGHDLAALTLWSTVDAALAAYGGILTAVRTLDGRPHGETLEAVDYYEVDEAEARRLPGRARCLRLTAGVVTRGLDAEIQKQLRAELPALAPEALEAYIGRRVLDADVEIAFMSLWSEVPAGTNLAEPLWPSISGRYDRFRIAVHEIVLEGTGAA
jgi:hypothetical protein